MLYGFCEYSRLRDEYKRLLCAKAWHCVARYGRCLAGWLLGCIFVRVWCRLWRLAGRGWFFGKKSAAALVPFRFGGGRNGGGFLEKINSHAGSRSALAAAGAGAVFWKKSIAALAAVLLWRRPERGRFFGKKSGATLVPFRSGSGRSGGGFLEKIKTPHWRNHHKLRIFVCMNTHPCR